MAFTGKATYGGGASLPEIYEDVSDIIGIVSPHETPLLDHLGDPRRVATSTVHEWLEDELAPNTVTIDQTSFLPNPTETLTVTLDDVTGLRAGDQLRAEGSTEVILVESVGSNNGLLVERGYGGTQKEPLTNNQVLQVIGNAAFEGEESIAASARARVRKQNYTQIFTAGVDVSGTIRAVNTIGVEDELEYQKQERLRELLRDLERTVIGGVAPASSPEGSSTVRRSMNGIMAMLGTNRFMPGVGDIPDGDGAGDDGLTEAVLNASLRAIWEQSSGSVDTIVVGGSQKRKINSFASNLRGYQPSDTAFSDMVSVYESDFGVCNVLLSRWVPADTVLLLDSSRISVLPLAGRSFGYKQLASTGDSDRGQLIGEYTLELMNETAHGVIEGLAV